MAGRKRKLTDKLKAHILSLIADGLTIRELFSRDDVPISWQSFRTYLINDDNLMSSYIKSKELEQKIENGFVDPKSAQNLVNLYKIITAHSQWSASKLSSKTYGKAAETLQIRSNNDQNLAISWMKPD